MAINAFEPWTFVTILILTFSLFLVITGAFTAYFGSGKSRKIGGALLGGGLVLGIVWGWLSGIANIIPLPTGLFEVIVQSILVLVAAAIGAILAIGLFLLAIMKS
ncbi:MAG: hypothetical protein V3R48_01455 [Thermoplasmata archaeon]